MQKRTKKHFSAMYQVNASALSASAFTTSSAPFGASNITGLDLIGA
jgi:hypothetical protein